MPSSLILQGGAVSARTLKDSVTQAGTSISQTVCANVTFIVPDGFWYRVASATSSLATRTWAELR